MTCSTCRSDLGEIVLLRKPGEYAPTRLRLSVPADTDLHGVLDLMATFLRAAGYSVPLDATLDLVHASTGELYDPDAGFSGHIENDGTAAEEE